ncbi:Polyadenylation factor subunit 2 [Elsinoe australis]|uniref:Polyadenylation factor subunit 2 n=1 Tax=Elsinoe australis TaxID=40998 RepID=A0A2P7ZDF0_9PEZI|nr:Polyadenylation factor subunit 2 [Elsinoe australis]
MASLSTPSSRMAICIARSQCPRPAILAWRNGRRFQTTSTETSSAAPPEPLAATLLSQFPSGPPKTGPSLGTNPTKHHSQLLTGKVTSAGVMSKTVRVDRPIQVWHNYLRKFYKSSKHYLVHDPANSLRKGDMVSFSRLPVPKGEAVGHVVREILVPFGQDIGQRPPVPSLGELKEEFEKEKAAKRERRELRRKAEGGNEEAKKRVVEEGIAIREVEKGTGRGRRVKRILEKDAKNIRK